MVLMKIERHLRRTGMSPSRFGIEAVRDPRLVFDLRQGRVAGDRLTRRIEAYLETARA